MLTFDKKGLVSPLVTSKKVLENIVVLVISKNSIVHLYCVFQVVIIKKHKDKNIDWKNIYVMVWVFVLLISCFILQLYPPVTCWHFLLPAVSLLCSCVPPQPDPPSHLSHISLKSTALFLSSLHLNLIPFTNLVCIRVCVVPSVFACACSPALVCFLCSWFVPCGFVVCPQCL